MKVPSVFKALYEGPGGIMVTGVGLLALLLSGVTLWPIGFGITLIVLISLAFAELWRATLSYEQKLSEVKAEVAEGRLASEKLQQLESDNEELRGELQALAAKASSPEASYETLLSAINVHLSVLSTVKQHRALRDEAPDALVTGARLLDDGSVLMTADCSCEPTVFMDESVVVVLGSSGEQISGISIPEKSSDYEIFVSFDPENLPDSLFSELQQRGAVVPNGYAIRLAGLVNSFEHIADGDLEALIEVLKSARIKIHAAVDMDAPDSAAPIEIDSEEAVSID